MRDSAQTRRRTFLSGIVGSTVITAGCATLGSESDTDSEPLEHVEYLGQNSWPMRGRDPANTSRSDAVGPDAAATPTTVSQGPFSTVPPDGPAIVDGAVYLPGGPVPLSKDSGEWSETQPYEAPTPALAHGHAYVTGPDGTTAFDLETGESRWEYNRASPQVSPVVDEDVVYLPIRENGEGLIALDAGSGERLWQYPHSLTRFSGVAVTSDTIYATETGDSESETGRIIALDPVTGDERWTETLDIVHVAPVASSGGVLVGTDAGRLHAFSPTGEKRWVRQVITARHGFLSACPALGTNYVFVPSNNGQVTKALDRETGDTVWEQETGLVHGSPAVGASNVYFNSDDALFAFSRSSGEVQWHSRNVGGSSALVLVEGKLYAHSGNTVVRLD